MQVVLEHEAHPVDPLLLVPPQVSTHTNRNLQVIDLGRVQELLQKAALVRLLGREIRTEPLGVGNACLQREQLQHAGKRLCDGLSHRRVRV